MLRQSWHLLAWKFYLLDRLQKEKIRSYPGELPLSAYLVQLARLGGYLARRAILHQATRSCGKDYPVSLTSNSVFSSELNLWVIERQPTLTSPYRDAQEAADRKLSLTPVVLF